MKAGIFIVAVIIAHVYSDNDFFTSIAQLEDVFHNEGRVISELENLLNYFKEHIHELERQVVEAKNHREGITDVAEYLQNPINSFHYLKVLHQFLTYIDTSLKEPILKPLNLYEEIEKSLGWPTYKDVQGAANALVRLQMVYKLNIDQLIQGRIFGKYQSASSLTALDCSTIGKAALKNKVKEFANAWLEKAFNMCYDDEDCDTLNRAYITEYYSYIAFKKENLSRSLELTELLLELEPKHERALNNKQYLLEEINNLPSLQRSGKFMMDPEGNHEPGPVSHYICQGFRGPSQEILSKLKCQYVHHNNPYLKIGPVKEEEAYLDPRIVIYKDVLYDSEIKEIQILAKQYLQRSKIIAGNPSNVRVSKVSWLYKSEKVLKLCNRFAAYSDLSHESSEPLQVVNYGLGGHYALHYDAIYYDDEIVSEPSGDRIATFLIYFNDVVEGGNTVFPLLGVSVKPEKGSAVFWHNLRRNGSLDDRTMHAACPVLVGTKWAANLWFHEEGHEFSRPCLLNNL